MLGLLEGQEVLQWETHRPCRNDPGPALPSGEGIEGPGLAEEIGLREP